MKKFAEAAHQAVQADRLLQAGIAALLEALASIDSQIAKLDDELKTFARRSEVAWRLMSVPSVGTITALAYIAAIEDPNRFRRTRDIGAYLGLTEKRYQSADTDVGLGISKQGDAMARHYLYEAANVLLTSVKKLSVAQLGVEADENHRRQTRPRGGGAQARSAAGAHVERRNAFRGHGRIGDKEARRIRDLRFPPLRQKRARTG